jgi:putative redox protein
MKCMKGERMSTSLPPSITLDLAWEGEMRFAGTTGQVKMVLDGNATVGPTPVQALGFGLAGCMAIDIVSILTKGRLPIQGLHARLVGERRSEDPKYFTRMSLHFVLSGQIPDPAVERAIELSREKYCSVWHSLRQDIDFRTTFEIVRTVPIQ